MSPPARLYVIDDERFDAHASHTPHPERPARLGAIRTGLVEPLRQGGASLVSARPALDEELLRVHTPEHVEELKEVLGRGHGHIDEDTFISEGTREATWLAAGGAAVMAERLLESDSAAFVLAARPPGHHATRTTAMGFCLLNNVAVAATTALARGAERVAILDWDVHHGNGTQAIFEHDPRVLFISIHQWPLYPGTGTSEEIGFDDARGRTVNVPLPQGASSREYAAVMKRLVLPVLEQFGPDLMLVSSGFDAHRDDPLGGLSLHESDFGALTNLTWDLTERVGARRLGIVLEGGYDLGALERSGRAVAEALLGKRFELEQSAPMRAAEQAIDDTRRVLAPYFEL